jgi:transcriptional regulator GlxA family with amidase domain
MGPAPALGVLVFAQVEELDFAGPWEMAGLWHQLAGGPVCRLIAEHKEPVRCAKGLSVNPDASFVDCPALDYLVIPGGPGTHSAVNNARTLEFIAARAGGCRAVLSICTGVFLLHAAGLLSGRRATTHWASLERLRALGDVEVVEERFVRDGQLWSSAGISAGLDAMLALIASVAGEEAAAKVQFASEYYPGGMVYGDLPMTHPRAPRYLARRT